MNSGREIKRPVTEQDIRQWEKGWADMMVTIWRENILRLGIVDTGRLHDSIRGHVADSGGQITIAHEFMMYGIYVARGVGRGYDIDGKEYRDKQGNLVRIGVNKGDLADKKNLNKRRRDWFWSKYLRSQEVLTQVERDLYGHAYMGTLSNVVQAMFGNSNVKGSDGTDVTHTIQAF